MSKLNKKLSETLIESRKRFDAEIALRNDVEKNKRENQETLENQIADEKSNM